jgi:hypothetical protein
MKIPPVDLAYVQEQFSELSGDLLEAWEDDRYEADSLTPPALHQAMHQLLDVLRSCTDATGDPADPEAPRELRILGEHGLQLLSELSRHADRLGMGRQARGLRDLCLPFALWILRCDGAFASWEPVVDAVAELANRLSEPDDLARLYGHLDDLVEAGNPTVTQASQRPATRAWRILLLNRAIVATRSHRPDLMERAFRAVVDWLPHDAPGFFEEAMEQMDVIGYPTPVRTVVEAYYRELCGQRTLH